MINTSDFASLTDDLQSIFNETAERTVAEMKGKEVFDVSETERKTHDHLVLHGMSGIKRVAEGSDLPNIQSNEGDNITFTQKYYGGLVAITKLMRKFDLHNQMESLVRSVATDAWEKVDQSMADVLTNGWATSYTDVYGDTETSVGPDGLALFSTAHTNNINSTTYRNQIKNSAGTENPALSRDAIVQARVDGMVHTDPAGVVRPVRLSKILVAPKNMDLAERLVYSDGVQGTANVDSNPLKGRVSVMEWERLQTDGQGTDRSDYWFMLDEKSKGESLMALFAERPELDAPDQAYRNKNWEYTVDFLYTLGRGHQAYVWGSQGDNT